MRLKSEIWAKAYLRRLAGEGIAAVVVRRGDADAGVILIKISHLDGRADLFGPAPAGYDGTDGDRRWVRVAGPVSDSDIEQRLATEIRLDRDVWVLEVEDRGGRHFLDDWLAKP